MPAAKLMNIPIWKAVCFRLLNFLTELIELGTVVCKMFSLQ